MRRATWLVLLVLTVVFSAAAAVMLQQRIERFAPAAVEQALFPGLEGRVNDVAELQFVTGEGAWTLKRDDKHVWRMVERGGYAADVDRVKQTVVALARSEILAAKTANPELHARLDLEEPKPKGPDGKNDAETRKTVKLTARDASGETLAALILGKTKQMSTSKEPAQIYVRRAGEDQTWLVEGFFDVREKPTDWLDTDMFEVPREKVQSVVIAHPGAGTLTLERNDKGELHVAGGLPEGRKEEEIRLTAASRALETPRFRDVRPASEVDMAKPVVATYRTDNGMTVTVRTVQADRKLDEEQAYWTTFDFAFDAAKVTGEGADPEAARKAAEAARARTEGWAYLFPHFTAQNFIHSMDTVTAPEKES